MKAGYCFLMAMLVLSASFTPRPAAADTHYHYELTASSYSYDADMDAAVESEFGPEARVADWTDLETHFAGEIAAFCDMVGLTEYRDHAWVYKNGSGFYSSNRHYFVERHNGSVPIGWFVHDHLDSHTLSLGSWKNSRPILARVQWTPVEGSSWARVKALFAE